MIDDLITVYLMKDPYNDIHVQELFYYESLILTPDVFPITMRFPRICNHDGQEAQKWSGPQITAGRKQSF